MGRRILNLIWKDEALNSCIWTKEKIQLSLILCFLSSTLFTVQTWPYFVMLDLACCWIIQVTYVCLKGFSTCFWHVDWQMVHGRVKSCDTFLVLHIHCVFVWEVVAKLWINLWLYHDTWKGSVVEAWRERWLLIFNKNVSQNLGTIVQT